MAKIRKLLQSAPPIYVQLEQPASKQKLESSYKAKAEPVKKKEQKDDSQAIDLDNIATRVPVKCAKLFTNNSLQVQPLDCSIHNTQPSNGHCI